VARRTISTTVLLTAEHENRLRLLAARSERSVDDCVHEAIELLLERHRAMLPEQLAWPTETPPTITAPTTSDRR
jgi:hypothetical protein